MGQGGGLCPFVGACMLVDFVEKFPESHSRGRAVATSGNDIASYCIIKALRPFLRALVVGGIFYRGRVCKRF